jgi:2-methylcitrate dehydratase PrpD
MDKPRATGGFDRRVFLGAGACTLVALPRLALAQEQGGAGQTVGAGKTLSEQIADFVVSFDLAKVPPQVIEHARTAFIDTVGVMLAGSREEVAQIACDMAKAEGSAPAAAIVGQNFRASAQLAALANGVAAHAMDYDFTFVSGQSVSPVIPAILPVAETVGATPAECAAAFIVGCEVASRIARANLRASNDGGWHTTGIVGAIAAAAACARLMKVPADKISDIIGIAASMASGIAVNYGTMTKPLHSGHAARDGVMAAMLGSRKRARWRARPATSRHSGAASTSATTRSRISVAAGISTPSG